MDDNDNRLFGVTAQVSWVPKPSYQLTIRTPRTSSEIEKFRRPSNPPFFIRSISTASQDENLNG
jgi:hypothetical protein